MTTRGREFCGYLILLAICSNTYYCFFYENFISSLQETIMFGIGMSELVIILVIVLIIFGAWKLPEIGKGLGKGIKNFKSAVSGNDD